MSNIKHTRNYLVGNVATKALGFISIPFFTHYLSIKEYGIMSIYITIVSFLSTLLGLGILGSFKRYYFEKDNKFGEFLFSNLVFLFFSSLIIGIIYFHFLNEISIYLNISKNVLQYAFFISFLSLVIRIKLDYLQIREKSIINAIIEFFRTFLMILLSIIFILILKEHKYMGKIYADLLISIILAIYSLYKFNKIIEFQFNLKYIKYALLFGLPVLPSMFSSFGLSFADRLMINKMTNSSDVGLYSFAYTLAMLLQVIVLSVGKSWQPIFYKSLSNKNYKTLDNIFLLNSKIVFTSSLLLIFFSPELISILAPKEYIRTEKIIFYLVIGFDFFFFYTIYVQYTSYAKKTYWDSIITISSVILNIGLNYYFIPIYGYIASAITTLVSYIFMFLGFYGIAKYILKFRIVKFSIIYKIIIYYIFIIIIFLILKIQNISYIYILMFKILLLLFFVFLILKLNIKVNNIEKTI